MRTAGNEARGVKRAGKPLPSKGGVGAGESADRGAPRHSRVPLSPEGERELAPERTCILTRTHGQRDELIRLALSPEGAVAVDVRARAPGRGAWIGVDRAALEAALAKGKLRGALLRAFKTAQVEVPADLPQRIADALARDALDRLGLEARGGTLATGGERIAEAARGGRVHLLLHAADAGEDGRRKLDQAWRVGLDEEGSGRQGVVIPADRTILSLALGRENVVSVAVIERGAALRVERAVRRWLHYVGRDGGAEPRDLVAGAVPLAGLTKDVGV